MIIGDGIMLGAGGESASIFVTGLSETDTVTATNGSKTLVGKWSQKPNPAIVVPDGYTQLEYIESTGTQYIDTNIVPTTNTKWEMTMLHTGGNAIGAGAGVNPKRFLISPNESGDNYVTFGIGTWYKSTYVSDDIRFHTYLIDVPNLVYGFDGQNTAFTLGEFNITHSLFLFARNNEGSIIYSVVKQKESKIYDNGDLVQYLIPCKRNSDSVIGMYDLVSNSFFENAGTGTFAAGAEVPQTIGGFLISKIKDYGTWTVTATDGTKTATQDVLVDAAEVFTVEVTL